MEICAYCYEKVSTLVLDKTGGYPAHLDGECSFCNREGVVIFDVPDTSFMVDCLVQAYLDLLKKIDND